MSWHVMVASTRLHHAIPKTYVVFIGAGVVAPVSTSDWSIGVGEGVADGRA